MPRRRSRTSPGARRKIAADRVRRRQSGQRGVRRIAGQFLLLGPGLLERHAGVRALGQAGVPRAPAEAGRRDAHRRSDGSADAGRAAGLRTAHAEGARLHRPRPGGRRAPASRRPPGHGRRAGPGFFRRADDIRRLPRRYGHRARGDLRPRDVGAGIRSRARGHRTRQCNANSGWRRACSPTI